MGDTTVVVGGDHNIVVIRRLRAELATSEHNLRLAAQYGSDLVNQLAEANAALDASRSETATRDAQLASARDECSHLRQRSILLKRQIEAADAEFIAHSDAAAAADEAAKGQISAGERRRLLRHREEKLSACAAAAEAATAEVEKLREDCARYKRVIARNRKSEKAAQVAAKDAEEAARLSKEDAETAARQASAQVAASQRASETLKAQLDKKYQLLEEQVREAQRRQGEAEASLIAMQQQQQQQQPDGRRAAVASAGFEQAETCGPSLADELEGRNVGAPAPPSYAELEEKVEAAEASFKARARKLLALTKENRNLRKDLRLAKTAAAAKAAKAAKAKATQAKVNYSDRNVIAGNGNEDQQQQKEQQRTLRQGLVTMGSRLRNVRAAHGTIKAETWLLMDSMQEEIRALVRRASTAMDSLRSQSKSMVAATVVSSTLSSSSSSSAAADTVEAKAEMGSPLSTPDDATVEMLSWCEARLAKAGFGGAGLRAGVGDVCRSLRRAETSIVAQREHLRVLQTELETVRAEAIERKNREGPLLQQLVALAHEVQGNVAEAFGLPRALADSGAARLEGVSGSSTGVAIVGIIMALNDVDRQLRSAIGGRVDPRTRMPDLVEIPEQTTVRKSHRQEMEELKQALAQARDEQQSLIEERIVLRERLEGWEMQKERVWDIPRNLSATKV